MKFKVFCGRVRDPNTMEDVTGKTILIGYSSESAIVFLGKGNSEIAARITVEYSPLLFTEDKVFTVLNDATIALANVLAKDLTNAKSN